MALGRMAYKLLGRQQGESSQCYQELGQRQGSHQLHSILLQTPHLLQQQHSNGLYKHLFSLRKLLDS